jgi:hypothetical protein
LYQVWQCTSAKNKEVGQAGMKCEHCRVEYKEGDIGWLKADCPSLKVFGLQPLYFCSHAHGMAHIKVKEGK